jgi:glycosyltransferase involved in cell wall biosynthesis
MACARPLLVSDVPTLAGSVIAEHCRLVAPKEANALAAAIIEIVQQPPTPARLEAARQAVLARYDKPVVMQKLAAIYDGVYAAAHASAPANQNFPNQQPVT